VGMSHDLTWMRRRANGAGVMVYSSAGGAAWEARIGLAPGVDVVETGATAADVVRKLRRKVTARLRELEREGKI
jgi:hypothetical protein